MNLLPHPATLVPLRKAGDEPELRALFRAYADATVAFHADRSRENAMTVARTYAAWVAAFPVDHAA